MSCWHHFLANDVLSKAVSLYGRQLARKYEREYCMPAGYDHKAHHPCHAVAGIQSLCADSWSSQRTKCGHYEWQTVAKAHHGFAPLTKI